MERADNLASSMSSKASTSRASDAEALFAPLNSNTRDNSVRIFFKAMDICNTAMGVAMMGCSKAGSTTEGDFYPLPMGINTREPSFTVSTMDRESSPGRMGYQQHACSRKG